VLNCPKCKKTSLIMQSNIFSCSNCGFKIGRTILKKNITPDMINELYSNGRTRLIQGFVSKKGKPFEASLVLEGDKVVFSFPGEKKDSQTTKIRIHSSSPGLANIKITGKVQYDTLVDFGLVSSRMAECLGVIAAAKYLKHHNVSGNVNISANNREFVQYVLRETVPRKKEMQNTIIYLWNILEEFEWDISYQRQQKTKLTGGTRVKSFPQSLFPWLRIEKTIAGDMIYVTLPNCPAAQAQIIASIRLAKKDGEGSIVIPLNARGALDAWINAVTKRNG